MTVENEKCPIQPSKAFEYVLERKDPLSDFALIKFKEHGRGAIFLSGIDNVLDPPLYISLQEAKALGFDDLVPFIEAYDPDNGFVISFISDGERSHRRVDRIKISSDDF